ncbi:MAG: aspartate dehydrogenase domain-containing protein [Rhizobiaceae bacterium]
MRIGFLGTGRIATNVAKALKDDGHDIIFAVSRSSKFADDLGSVPHFTLLPDRDVMASVDLVVEAASPGAVEAFGVDILKASDLCVLSTTALRNAELEQRLTAAQASLGHKMTLLSGGIVAIDALRAVGRDLVSIEIETTKPPRMWGIEDHSEIKVLFVGSTRDASTLFERNVNVHATLAYYSLGFDRCQSRLVSDPNTGSLTQRLKVRGEDFGWDLELFSTPIGGVSGSLTPRMTIQTVREILAQK